MAGQHTLRWVERRKAFREILFGSRTWGIALVTTTLSAQMPMADEHGTSVATDGKEASGTSTCCPRRRTPGSGRAPDLNYTMGKGRALCTVEGPAQIADMVETGLKGVSGAAIPPAASDVQTSAASTEIAADFGTATGGLARSQAAAHAALVRLRARACVRNNEWQFEKAETDFQALVAEAERRKVAPGEMLEPLLNLALNVSNYGRCIEADRLFREADAQAARPSDPLPVAQVQTYRALHSGALCDTHVTAVIAAGNPGRPTSGSVPHHDQNAPWTNFGILSL